MERGGVRRPNWTRRWAIVLWLGFALFTAQVLATRNDGDAGAAPPSNTRGLPSHPTTYSDGGYQFAALQPDESGRPVGYNPCERVSVIIDPRHAPPGTAAQLHEAVGIVDRVSGLRLVDEGSEGELTGPRILIAFASPREYPQLTGVVAESEELPSSIGRPHSRLRYKDNGLMVVNYRAFDDLPSWNREAVFLHEFGHLVGLAHTPDRRQLMSAHGQGTATYQHGDLTGLAKLGALPCA